MKTCKGCFSYFPELLNPRNHFTILILRLLNDAVSIEEVIQVELCLDNDTECEMCKNLKGRGRGVLQGTIIFGRARPVTKKPVFG
jgi:hypothetical protein